MQSKFCFGLRLPLFDAVENSFADKFGPIKLSNYCCVCPRTGSRVNFSKLLGLLKQF